MKPSRRFLIALCLFLSGLVGIARADLTAGTVSWQRFAQAYETVTPTTVVVTPSATGGATSVTVDTVIANEGGSGGIVVLLLATLLLLTLFTLSRVRRM